MNNAGMQREVEKAVLEAYKFNERDIYANLMIASYFHNAGMLKREQEIREQLEGNLCRCTGYQNIVKAVQHGAAAMKS